MIMLCGIFCLHLSLNLRWKGPSCKESWKSQWDNATPKKLKKLTPIICMGIFLARNKEIFQERPKTPDKVGTQVIVANDSIPHDVVNPKTRNIIIEEADHSFPGGYFDGETMEVALYYMLQRTILVNFKVGWARVQIIMLNFLV